MDTRSHGFADGVSGPNDAAWQNPATNADATKRTTFDFVMASLLRGVSYNFVKKSVMMRQP